MADARWSGRRTLFCVALLVIGTFAALETVTRVKLFRMSLDFVRFQTYPARAERLVTAPPIRLALIGNSATERGVELRQLDSTLSTASRRVQTDEFLADGSGINTWYWILQRYFFSERRVPDLAVVTFFQGNMEDGGEQLDVGRLAQFFTTPRDWPDVFKTDLTSVDQRVEFVLSSTWATFAARDRLRDRLLRVLPGYVDYAVKENAINFRYGRRPAPPGTIIPRRSWNALQRLLDHARESNTRLCFVAFPMRHTGAPYPLDPEMARRIREAGMELLDLRELPELVSTDYMDDIHLNLHGQALYTARFAEALRPLLSTNSVTATRE